ncbi:MAG: hypothetical protein ACHQNT_04590 [Bacteroidia bacterium]
MSDIKDNKKESKPIVVSSFSKELLLIVFGVLIGILGNQVFFKENKDYEMKTELQKDLLKEQYQFLNRILLFTHRYEISTAIYYTQPVYIRTFMEKGTNKVVKTDTIPMGIQDTLFITLPSFLIKDDRRKQFIDDIEYIKTNKDKIDHEIYAKFEELLDITIHNPIPKSSDKTELKNSSWNKKEVQDEWLKKLSELYYLTHSKLY